MTMSAVAAAAMATMTTTTTLTKTNMIVKFIWTYNLFRQLIDWFTFVAYQNSRSNVIPNLSASHTHIDIIIFIYRKPEYRSARGRKRDTHSKAKSSKWIPYITICHIPNMHFIPNHTNIISSQTKCATNFMYISVCIIEMKKTTKYQTATTTRSTIPAI